MKKTKRESEREKSSNLANSVISSHAAKTAIPLPANNVMPSQCSEECDTLFVRGSGRDRGI